MRVHELGTEWEKAQHNNDEEAGGETAAEEWDREILNCFHHSRAVDLDSRSTENTENTEKI
jgi:hypothetical protein